MELKSMRAVRPTLFMRPAWGPHCGPIRPYEPIRHMSDSNRATLLTAPGAAAIAVVRLTGPLTQTFLQRHFSKPVAPGRCIHGTLRDGDRIIDDPVVVLLPDQRGADINLH